MDVLGDGGKNMPSHKGDCAGVFNRGCKSIEGKQSWEWNSLFGDIFDRSDLAKPGNTRLKLGQ